MVGRSDAVRRTAMPIDDSGVVVIWPLLRLPRRKFGLAARGCRAARGVDDLEQRAQRLGHALARVRGQKKRRLLAGALQAAALQLDVLRRHRVDLGQRDDLRLVEEPAAVGVELRAHGLVGFARVLSRSVDEMQQHAAALDVAEEAVAEAGAFVRPLDETRNVGQHELATVRVDDAELWRERGEGIVRDLRLGRADAGEERRLAGVRQTDESRVRDQLQPQPDPALLSRQAGVGVARRAVGRRLEVRVAEAAVAAAQKEIDRLTIKATFGGLLESDTAEIGSLLQPGSACATVIQLDPIKIVGFVPETERDRITVGAPAGARLLDGTEVSGNVTFLSRSADKLTRTFRVEMEIPNPDITIADGQTADILIASDGKAAHLIPQSSLTLNDSGALGVRTILANNATKFVEISLLRDTPNGVWVSGLDPEVSIIVVGQEYVIDGIVVDPTYRELGQ